MATVSHTLRMMSAAQALEPKAPEGERLDPVLATAAPTSVSVAKWSRKLGVDFVRNTVASAGRLGAAVGMHYAGRILKRQSLEDGATKMIIAAQAAAQAKARMLGTEGMRELIGDLRPAVARAMGKEQASAVELLWSTPQQMRESIAGCSQLQTALGHSIEALSGAFVEIGSNRLTMSPHMPLETALPLATHELAHVEQRLRYNELLSRLAESPSVGAAAFAPFLERAVLEGQAQIVAGSVLGSWAGEASGLGGYVLRLVAPFATQMAKIVCLPLSAEAGSWQSQAEARFVYGKGVELAQAVAARGDTAAWSLFDHPPLTLQEVIEPALYFAGEHPPSPKPIGLADLLPGSRPKSAWMYGLDEADPEPLRQAWRGDWQERVFTDSGDVVARAFLFNGPEQAEAFVAHQADELAKDSDISRGLDTRSGVRREGNVVIAITGCPSEHFEAVEERALRVFAPPLAPVPQATPAREATSF